MPKELTIEVEPDSELAHAVEDADVSNITLVVDGRRFKISVERPEPYWDKTSVSAHFAQFGNLLEGIDVEELKSNIYRWRIEGSRKPVDE